MRTHEGPEERPQGRRAPTSELATPLHSLSEWLLAQNSFFFLSTSVARVSVGGVEPKVTKVRVDASVVAAMMMAHFPITVDKVVFCFPPTKTHARTFREQSRQLFTSDLPRH